MDSARPVHEWRKQSFDFAADSTKQLITVATGVVTVTILFSKDLDVAARYSAYAAWIVLILSVAAGIAVLFNLSGNLNNAANGMYRTPNVNAPGLSLLMKSQIGLFCLGIVLVFVFGYFAARVHSSPETKNINVTCVLPSAAVPAQPPSPPPPQPAIRKRHRRCCCCKKTSTAAPAK